MTIHCCDLHQTNSSSNSACLMADLQAAPYLGQAGMGLGMGIVVRASNHQVAPGQAAN